MGASIATWYVRTKLPQRSGSLALSHLQAPVTVDYDERGVPHIQAENEADLYRALGYVHAQDRLFQMEMVRRLARGELAEVLGPQAARRRPAVSHAGHSRARRRGRRARWTRTARPTQALLAYLDGINQYQATHPAPIEFDMLGIPKRPFTPQDTVPLPATWPTALPSAFRTEPALTYVRDKLGAEYLRRVRPGLAPAGRGQATGAVAALSGRRLGRA